MRRYTTWLGLVAALLAVHGCQYYGSRPCPPDGTASAYGPAYRFFHPLAPRAVVPAPPPGAVIYPPGGVPAAPGAIPPAPPVPVSPSPELRNYVQPADTNPPPNWRPSPEASTRQIPNETRQPPLAPGGSDDRAGTPALPVGIPQFAMIKKNIASGLRPTHLEGLDWLKNNNYRMAVYIRAPGEPDDADRKQFVDKLGMKLASLVVSADSLTLEVVDGFNHIVADPSNRPLFVYDKDGSLAGALWYLHLRMIDQQSDEDARAAAARIGLKEEHRDMWLAIQKILSGKQR